MKERLKTVDVRQLEKVFDPLCEVVTQLFEEKGMCKKVMWMSRHSCHPSQLNALKKIFGNDVQIVQDPNPFDNAETIVRRFKSEGFDDLVVVAPLSVIDHLCRQGIRPLWSEAVEENDPLKIEFRGARGQGFRFVRFRRIKCVRIEFEDE